MEKKALNPAAVPQPVGGYSQALEVRGDARLLFISGQVPEDVAGEVPEGFDAQCRQVWSNIGEILAAGGLGYEDLIKVTTYLTDRSQAQRNSEIRREILGSARPSLTVVVAQTLDSKWLLEIEAVAAGA